MPHWILLLKKKNKIIIWNLKVLLDSYILIFLEVSEIQKCISNMKIACEKQINMQVVDVKMSILHWLTF